MRAMTEQVRIAMWSGPRNLSTALLRSWGNRTDAAVSDEPLYAHYLRATGADHPARDQVLATLDDDWRRVAVALCGPVPDDKPIWYQKHMTHHVTNDVELDWLDGLRNCFLIREPAHVVASYARVRTRPTLADLGFTQQARLFDHVYRRTGCAPPAARSTSSAVARWEMPRREMRRVAWPRDRAASASTTVSRRPTSSSRTVQASSTGSSPSCPARNVSSSSDGRSAHWRSSRTSTSGRAAWTAGPSCVWRSTRR